MVRNGINLLGAVFGSRSGLRKEHIAKKTLREDGRSGEDWAWERAVDVAGPQRRENDLGG